MIYRQNLNLGITGNCAINAMIDESASIVFACWPRPDGDLIFSSLLHGSMEVEDTVASFDIRLLNQVAISREYIGNTAILRTVLTDAKDIFKVMLENRNDFGYLSEVFDPDTNELWGNYPQAYSYWVSSMPQTLYVQRANFYHTITEKAKSCQIQ